MWHGHSCLCRSAHPHENAEKRRWTIIRAALADARTHCYASSEASRRRVTAGSSVLALHKDGEVLYAFRVLFHPGVAAFEAEGGEGEAAEGVEELALAQAC